MAIQQLTPTKTRSRSRIALIVTGSILLSGGLLAAALIDLSDVPSIEDPAADSRDQVTEFNGFSNNEPASNKDGDLLSAQSFSNSSEEAGCQSVIDELSANNAAVNELPICPLETPLFSTVEFGLLGIVNGLVTNRGDVNGQRVIAHFSLGDAVNDALFAGDAQEGEEISTDKLFVQFRRAAGGNFDDPHAEFEGRHTVYRSSADHPLPFYTVLDGLVGGDTCENPVDEFVCGNARYELRIAWNPQHDEPAEEEPHPAQPLDEAYTDDRIQFLTLNRIQTIAYNYSIILGETFGGHVDRTTLTDADFVTLAEEHPELQGRITGVRFYNDPRNIQEVGVGGNDTPIDLASMRFVLMGDRTFQEFESRIRATSELIGINEAVLQLYRSVFDRIYPNNINLVSDTEGQKYWRELISNGTLDEYGVTFSMLASDEFYNHLLGSSEEDSIRLQGNYAYLTTLRRGPDQGGLNFLTTFARGSGAEDPKRFMQEQLIESDEFENRIASFDETIGREAAVGELYQTCLFRAADQGGLAYWAEQDLNLQELIKQFCVIGE